MKSLARHLAPRLGRLAMLCSVLRHVRKTGPGAQGRMQFGCSLKSCPTRALMQMKREPSLCEGEVFLLRR